MSRESQSRNGLYGLSSCNHLDCGSERQLEGIDELVEQHACRSMPTQFGFMWKCGIVHASLRVLIISSILGSEEMVPDAEYGTEVFVLMFLVSRMMDAVELRRNHNVAKNTEIGFDVAVIKAGIPGPK